MKVLLFICLSSLCAVVGAQVLQSSTVVTITPNSVPTHFYINSGGNNAYTIGVSDVAINPPPPANPHAPPQGNPTFSDGPLAFSVILTITYVKYPGQPMPTYLQPANYSGTVTATATLAQKLLFPDIGPAYQGILSASGSATILAGLSSTPPPVGGSGGDSPTTLTKSLASSEPTPQGGVDYPFSSNISGSVFLDQSVPNWSYIGQTDGYDTYQATITLSGYNLKIGGSSTIPTPSSDQADSNVEIAVGGSSFSLTWP